MKGISCNIDEFNTLQAKIHNDLKDKLANYNADAWAKEGGVPKHQTTGELLLPVSKGKRYEIIKTILTQAQIDRIVEVLSGDPDWFPPEPI